VKKYVIERNIPKVGSLEREQLKAASAKSNEALREVGPGIQWQESYVADDKTFCVYLAENESLIHKHAELSGFPASKITEVKTIIDPTTGGISTIL
jgi:Nickel responsive protein SCO4226-like